MGHSSGWARLRFAICLLGIGILLNSSNAHADRGRDLRGAPVRAFRAADYGWHPQCWSMVEDSRGLIHVANTNGVMSYDGARWEHRLLENGASATALCIGPDGDVYVGGTGQLARLTADEAGEFTFEALGGELPGDDRPHGDVWYAVASSRDVFMASLTEIYRVRMDGGVERIDALPGLELNNRFFAIEVWRDILWVAVDGGGLYRWMGDRFELIHSRDPDVDPADATHPFRQDSLSDLCATETHLMIFETDRIFRFDGEHIEPFSTTADSTLASSWIYAGASLDMEHIVVGTVEAGAFLFNEFGQELGRWDAESGLLQNGVSDFGTDDEGGLWVCQENGIVRLDLEAPIDVFPGITGLVSDVEEVDGRVYISTSQGFFRLAGPDAPNERFEIIETSDDYTGMVQTADGFFVSSSSGITRWHGDHWGRHVVLNYPSAPLASRNFDHLLVMNSRDGLVMVSTADGQPSVISTNPLPLAGRTLAEGEPGEFWIGSDEGAVLRVQLDEAATELDSIEIFGQDEGVPASYCMVAGIDGRILLGTGEGLFEFEGSGFVRVDGSGGAPLKVEQLRHRDGELWALVDGNVGRFRLEDSAEPRWDWEGAFSVHARSGRLYSFALLGSNVWASQADRLVRRNLDGLTDTPNSFHPILRRVSTAAEVELWAGTRVPESIEVDHADNSMRFEFAATTQRGENPPTYQSMLEGHDSRWSDWSGISFREYTNLGEGAYEFRLRAMDSYGRVSSEIGVPLRVNPPWYRTHWAITLFVLLAISSFTLVGTAVGRLRSRRLMLQKRKLKRLIERKTEELRLANLKLQASNSALETVNNELRRIDDQRSELLGIAAHDLKTPLSSIQMVSRILADQIDTSTESGQLFDIIDEASERMLDRIQRILSSAEAEAGQMKIDLKDCDVLSLARELIRIQQPAATAKGQALRLHIDPEDAAQAVVRGDCERLHQAMENLISNAIKYSPHDSPIDVKLELSGEDQIRFLVTDRGPGLDMLDREMLFLPFQRLKPQPTGEEDSCGLGLYIAKHIVERHDGRIWCDSQPQEGSTFGIELPRSSACPLPAND